MKYIIMAGGQGTRWNNYKNIPKHLVKINGENFLERIVRQLKENGVKDIIITSSDSRYEVEGAKRYEPIYENKAYNLFNYELLNEPMIFLYGDTYYNDSVIKSIINTKTDKLLYFGTKQSIIGIKVIDYDYFKNLVKEVAKLPESKINGWATYQVSNNLKFGCKDIKDNFLLFNEDIINMNSPKEYKELLKNNNKDGVNND